MLQADAITDARATCWPGTFPQALRIAVNDEIVKLEQAS